MNQCQKPASGKLFAAMKVVSAAIQADDIKYSRMTNKTDERYQPTLRSLTMIQLYEVHQTYCSDKTNISQPLINLQNIVNRLSPQKTSTS